MFNLTQGLLSWFVFFLCMCSPEIGQDFSKGWSGVVTLVGMLNLVICASKVFELKMLL